MFEATRIHAMLLCLGMLLAADTVHAQESALDLPGMPQEISTVMRHQQAAWNQGDLVGFMQGYWRSDSLMFIGKNGMTRGHDATLARYESGYPDRQAMGELSFDNHIWIGLSNRSGWLVGSWRLDKSDGEVVQGMYSLLWMKKDGGWVIVADHSS
jgi:hypothetical protein